MDEPTPPLLLPVDRVPDGPDDEVHPVLLQTDEGLVGLAFTTPESLAAVLGDAQPWVALPVDDVADAMTDAGAAAVVVDAVARVAGVAAP